LKWLCILGSYAKEDAFEDDEDADYFPVYDEELWKKVCNIK